MFIRNCPKCNKEITYKSKHGFKASTKNKSLCKSCASFKRMESKEARENISKKVSGENNPMFGKSLYKNWKDKFGEEVANEKHKEYKKNMATWENGIDANINRTGKTYLEFHGKEKADKIRKKQSDAVSGENNPMFGKPSPVGSGNGWSGWYKDWYFRSLKELSFMITVIERFNFNWENAEKKKYKISYIDYKGTSRNYFADFILNDKYMVEIKPVALHTSTNNKLKEVAAIEFCKNNNLKYKLLDSIKLSDIDIIKLYDNKLIKFIERYEKKFKERYYCN